MSFLILKIYNYTLPFFHIGMWYLFYKKVLKYTKEAIYKLLNLDKLVNIMAAEAVYKLLNKELFNFVFYHSDPIGALVFSSDKRLESIYFQGQNKFNAFLL